MNDDEFFGQFDEFSGDVIGKLRDALTITIKDLKASESEMALAQIEILRQRARRRLKVGEWDFDLMNNTEEHVSRVHAAVLAVIDHALDDAKEFTIDCDDAIFGSEEDDAREALDHAPELQSREQEPAEAKPKNERLSIGARRRLGGPNAWMKG